MSALFAEQPAGLGHNNPPSDAELAAQAQENLREHLKKEASSLLESARKVAQEAIDSPTLIEDDATSGALGDIVISISSVVKSLKAMHKKEKEPFLEGGRTVDGFFKTPIDHLEKCKETLSLRMGAYQKLKADAERRKREAEAQRVREEEEKKRQEALKLAREAEELAALKRKDLAAETMEKAAVAVDEANIKGKEAALAEKKADASHADLTRTRGSMGSVQSLRETWEAIPNDPQRIREDADLEALRAHLPIDAILKAAKQFVEAGGRELKGFTIQARHTVVVR